MRELFIYYRIRSEDTASARAAVVEFQAELCRQHPHLQARLLCRPETIDNRQTWMETYSTDRMRDTVGISAELQSEIEARATVLAPFIDGARHTEAFIACVS